jgi:U3 small nucleolar RNA-associated protein MPP10
MSEQLESLASRVDTLATQPELFVARDDKVADQLRGVLRGLFSSVESPGQQLSGLGGLYTEGFDSEQIWAQVQLQNAPLLDKVTAFLEDEGSVTRDEQSSSDGEGYASSGVDVDELEAEAPFSASAQEEEEDEEDEEGDHQQMPSSEAEQEEESEQEDRDGTTSFFPVPMDDSGDEFQTTGERVSTDEFFSMRAMEEFADDMEERGSDAEQFDLDLENDEEMDEEALMLPEGDELTYADLYAAPRKIKRPADPEEEMHWEVFTDDEEAAAMRGESSVADAVVATQANEPVDVDAMTPHERRQYLLQQQISDLEKTIIRPRNWELTGEVMADQRPEDSLLEKQLEFNHIGHVQEQFTEEANVRLEAMIRERIAHSLFDDVERVVAEKQKPKKVKKELDHDKSQLSLAEIYEKDYVDKHRTDGSSEQQEKQTAQEREIGELFAQLSYQLDSLCNFNFTPRPPRDEMQVVAQESAIAMEEIIPDAVNAEQMLAPQDLYSSRSAGAPVADSELTQQQRKAVFQSTKRKKHKRSKHEKLRNQQREMGMDAHGKEGSKDDVLRQLENSETVQSASSSSAAGPGGGGDVNFAQSTKFFEELQRQVDSGNAGGVRAVERQKKKRKKMDQQRNSWKL